MALKFLSEPEYFLNTETGAEVEKYELASEENEAVFTLGDKKIGFDRFMLEVHLQGTKILNIFMVFPDIEKDRILEISEYFNMSEEHLKEVETVEKATLVFSVVSEAIEKYMQPNYQSLEDSKYFFSFKDEEDNIILLDFYYFEIVALT